jgi:hypothetical protein
MHSVVGWRFRRFRRRYEDNTKMYLTESAWDDLNSIGLAQNKDQWRAVVNRVINIRSL